MIADDWTEIGARVRDARLAVSLSQGQLAELVGLERTALLRVESGDRRLTALEAARIADAVRVPLNLLVWPRPLAITSARASITDEAGMAERQRARADLLLEAHAADARWLVSHGYLVPPDRVRVGPVNDAESAAAAALSLRQTLGLGDGPLGPLVDIAERAGVYLAVIDEDLEGASLDDGEWGVAVVGARAQPGRRRSTAAHELAHYVAGDAYSSDLSVSSSTDERERVIESLAAALLLPSSVVGARTGTATTYRRRWEALVRVAAEYRVSWSLAVATAHSINVLPNDERRRATAQVPTKGDFLSLTGDDVQPDVLPGERGHGWRRAVLAAYSEGAIGPDRAADLLGGVLSVEDLPSRDLDDLW